jgi:D-aminoacyl-tRNA deacylase
MRAVVQRVRRARVKVGEETTGEIATGLLVLVGVTHTDGEDEARTMADKIWGLRIFDADDAEHGAASVAVGAVGGAVLVVSQFTLYGDVSRGRRPSWSGAAPAPQAEPLVEALVEDLGALGATVATGRFGAHMGVELENDGPVTLVLEV